MQWQIGGNFEPVREICGADWNECPKAIANYAWAEIVTDVVECLTNNDRLAWQLAAVAIVIALILRLTYRKLKCVNEAALSKETLHRVDRKMQDLELKMSILTYKIQYGSWPLPHQVRGPTAKRQLRNIRLTLSNFDDRHVWIKRMLLSPSSDSCHSRFNVDASSNQRLNDIFNVNSGHNFRSDRSESTNSNSKCSKNSSERSYRCKHWRRTVRNSDIIKLREQRQSRSEKFLLRYRNAQLLRERSKNTLPEQCTKYLESMDDCKRFLQQLKTGNRCLGLVQDSSETNDETLTSGRSKEKIQTTLKGSPARNSEKVASIAKPTRQKSKRLSPDERVDENNLNASNIVSSTPSKEAKTDKKSAPAEMINVLLPRVPQQTKSVQSSQQALQLIRRRLESLHSTLQKCNSTGSIGTFEENEKMNVHVSSFRNVAKTSSAGDVCEDRRSQATSLDSQKKQSKITRWSNSKRSETTFRRSPRSSVRHNRAKIREGSKESVSSEETGTECRSVDDGSECKSFLSVESCSDAVVYNDERYHRANEFAADDEKPLKNERRIKELSSDSRRKDEDDFDEIQGFPNPSVSAHQFVDVDDPVFVSPCLSEIEALKPSDSGGKSTMAMLREALRMRQEANFLMREEACEEQFESKLLDVITEESPSTSTAKTSTTFVFIGTCERKETEEDKDPNLASSVSKERLLTPTSRNVQCPLAKPSEYFSVGNLIGQDDVRSAKEVRNEGSNVELSKAKLDAGSIVDEKKRDETEDETEDKMDDNLKARMNAAVRDSVKTYQKTNDETTNEIFVAKNVTARESDELWGQFCEESNDIDDRTKDEASVTEVVMERKAVESWAKFCGGPVKSDDDIRDVDDLARPNVNNVRCFTELFSRSRQEAIAEIKEVMKCQSENNSGALTGDKDRPRILTFYNEEQDLLERDSSSGNGNVHGESVDLSPKIRPETCVDITELKKNFGNESVNSAQSSEIVLSSKIFQLNTEPSRVIRKDERMKNPAKEVNIGPRSRLDTEAFETEKNLSADKSVSELRESKANRTFFNTTNATEDSKLCADDRKSSEVGIFDRNGITDKCLKKIDSSPSSNFTQRSAETITPKDEETNIKTGTADSKKTTDSETMENICDKDSVSTPSTNFSSNTSASYVDAISASSFFSESTITPPNEEVKAIQDGVDATNGTFTSSKQRPKNPEEYDLPPSKPLKSTSLNDESQLREPEVARNCQSAQNVKNSGHSVQADGKNSCFVEWSRRFERSTSNLRKPLSKYRPKGMELRNDSSDSIKSGTRSRTLIPETKVSSRSCIPVLKTRLAREIRPKSPARGPLTMTMLWTVNSLYGSREPSEKSVEAEGRLAKRKYEEDFDEDHPEGGKESRIVLMKDKDFVLMKDPDFVLMKDPNFVLMKDKDLVLMKDKDFVLTPRVKPMLYMQIFTDHQHDLMRIVDPKTFLGYLRDGELEIENVVHEDRSESLICRKNSFLTVIEQANVGSRVLRIRTSGVGDDHFDGRACVTFKPVLVRRREIYVTAKPSVIHASTSVSGLKNLENVERTVVRKEQSRRSAESVGCLEGRRINESVQR